MARRWLDIAEDSAPLPARLEPVPVDYKILALYARDTGPRSAALALDIGPGTSDLASRDRVTLRFDVQPARRVEVDVLDQDGRPVTCSWLVTDASGRVLPAQARRSPPDFFFQRKVFRADGEVLWLPPVDYPVQTARRPEYLVERSTRRVPASGSVRWKASVPRC